MLVKLAGRRVNLIYDEHLIALRLWPDVDIDVIAVFAFGALHVAVMRVMSEKKRIMSPKKIQWTNSQFSPRMSGEEQPDARHQKKQRCFSRRCGKGSKT